MAITKTPAKTYSSTFLYRKFDKYEKRIFEFLMNADVIDKDKTEFEDIIYDVKRRQINNCILTTLKNENVVLLIGNEPLDKAFKVFCAKDIKHSKTKKKVFIDCSGIIVKSESGGYECSSQNIDIFISYLVSAMINYIYYIDDNRFTTNSSIVSIGADCFSKLFFYIVDYLAKISTIPGARNKCLYLGCLYYFDNILGIDFSTESCTRIARKVSGVSEREAYIVNMDLKDGAFENIKLFVESTADVLRLSKLTLEVFIERWMWLYGTGTAFATELFPAFATMITDAYIGSYINNQKTIEKILGPSMVDFSKKIIEIGSNAL